MAETSKGNRIALALFPFLHWLIGVWCFLLAIVPFDVYALLGESPWWSSAIFFGVAGLLTVLLAVFAGLLSLSQETSPTLYSFLPLFFSCVAPFVAYVTCFTDPSVSLELLLVMKILSLIISVFLGTSVMAFIARDLPPLAAFLLGHPTEKLGFFQKLKLSLLDFFNFRKDPGNLLWILGFFLLVTLIYYDDRLARIPTFVVIPAGYLAALLCIRYVKGRRGYFLSSFLWVHLLLAFFAFLGWGVGLWLSSYGFDLAFFPYISGYLLLWSYDQGDRRLKEIMEGPSTPSGLPTDMKNDCREGMDLGSRR